MKLLRTTLLSIIIFAPLAVIFLIIPLVKVLDRSDLFSLAPFLIPYLACVIIYLIVSDRNRIANNSQNRYNLYWLKWGLWTGICLSILGLITIGMNGTMLLLVLSPQAVDLCQYLYQQDEEAVITCMAYMLPVVNLIYGFIFGALAGIIYGKAKNKITSQ
jgi:hypothetical protein